MQTAIWLTAGILAATFGFWLARLATAHWPRLRVPLMIASALALTIEIFVLDVEPPSETSTVRATGEALSFPVATLFWMLHGFLFGGVFGSATAGEPAERDTAKKHPG